MLKWIRDLGQKAQELNTEKQHIEMVEVDEMHSYIGSKNNVRCGLLLINIEKGSSISLLVTGETKQQKNFGKRKKDMR